LTQILGQPCEFQVVGVPGSDEASDCVELACDNVAGATAAFGSCAAAPGETLPHRRLEMARRGAG
jgi:hypothetical protein